LPTAKILNSKNRSDGCQTFTTIIRVIIVAVTLQKFCTYGLAEMRERPFSADPTMKLVAFGQST
jgi:hypothetical protein